MRGVGCVALDPRLDVGETRVLVIEFFACLYDHGIKGLVLVEGMGDEEVRGRE